MLGLCVRFSKCHHFTVTAELQLLSKLGMLVLGQIILLIIDCLVYKMSITHQTPT